MAHVLTKEYTGPVETCKSRNYLQCGSPFISGRLIGYMENIAISLQAIRNHGWNCLVRKGSAVLTSCRSMRWSNIDEHAKIVSFRCWLCDQRSDILKRANMTCHPNSMGLWNSASVSIFSCGRGSLQSRWAPNRDSWHRRIGLIDGLPDSRTDFKIEEGPLKVVIAISRYLYLC